MKGDTQVSNVTFEDLIGENDLVGDDLSEAIRNDPELIKETIEGLKQIEAGENSVITLGELRESLKNDRPLF